MEYKYQVSLDKVAGVRIRELGTTHQKTGRLYKDAKAASSFFISKMSQDGFKFNNIKIDGAVLEDIEFKNEFYYRIGEYVLNQSGLKMRPQENLETLVTK